MKSCEVLIFWSCISATRFLSLAQRRSQVACAAPPGLDLANARLQHRDLQTWLGTTKQHEQ